MLRTQSGRQYLVRVASSGTQTSLGPHSPENALIFERFMARKAMASEQLKQLEGTAQTQVSLLGIFQKVDKTFAFGLDQKYTAVNTSGFEIDVIRRTANSVAGTAPHPLLVSDFEEDFWVVQISSGQMATMHTPSPSSFVRIKTAIAERPDRDPLKSPKDKLQAQVVQKLLTDYGLQQIIDARRL